MAEGARRGARARSSVRRRTPRAVPEWSLAERGRRPERRGTQTLRALPSPTPPAPRPPRPDARVGATNGGRLRRSGSVKAHSGDLAWTLDPLCHLDFTVHDDRLGCSPTSTEKVGAPRRRSGWKEDMERVLFGFRRLPDLWVAKSPFSNPLWKQEWDSLKAALLLPMIKTSRDSLR